MKKEELINIGVELGLEKKSIEIIILYSINLSKSQFFLLSDVEEKYIKEIENNFFRLKNGEPLEYILSEVEFYGKNFYVDSRVLIPRDDTEILVNSVLNKSPHLTSSNRREIKGLTLIDVGTGSGVIPISIALNNKFKIKDCYVVDISDEALEVARINVEKYNLQDKINLIKSDLLEKILTFGSLQFTDSIVITANLPYIKDDDYNNMDESVIKYEPKKALYGGEKTGFEMYEKLINQAIELKNNLKIETGNLKLFIEIGFDQYEYSMQFLKNLGLKFEYFKDNSNIERVIKINI